jgi:carbon storage regulator CsrA
MPQAAHTESAGTKERRPAVLVVSRRLNEDIVFPNLGIRVRVLRAAGNRVRLGIDAPEFVEIRRSELEDDVPAAQALPLNHRIRNELNTVRLALEVYDRQIEIGDLDGANRTFMQLIGCLRRAEGECAPLLPPEPMSRPEPTDARHPRVLVVDDDDNERELLAGLLQMDGCDVVTANDGLDALDTLAHNVQPDVIVLDMHMPRLNGRDTLSAIRSSDRFRDVVVFAVSGSAPEQHGIAVGQRCGVDEWFKKPLNPNRLVSQIHERVHS